MTLAVLRYLVYLPVSWVTVIAAWVLAPVAALPFFVRSVPPPGFYGDPRGGEWLTPWWSWITTHDAHVDTYAYGSKGRKHWLLKRYNIVDPSQNPGWLKYANRVLWIWRNPAYSVKHFLLGFDSQGQGVTLGRSFTYYTVNLDGRYAFLVERKFKHLHVQFGWKLYRTDPDGRRMFAFRVKPEFKEGWS